MGWITIGVMALGATAVAGPAPERPQTVPEFVERCQSDAQFCRIQILAATAVLEREGKVCLRTASKEQVAYRVAETIEHVIEEDPETFKALDYRALIEQLLTLLWPCEPIA